jgi:hypothetical protein
LETSIKSALDVSNCKLYGRIFEELFSQKMCFVTKVFPRTYFLKKWHFGGFFWGFFFLRIAVLRKNMFSCCARESFLLYLHGKSCSPSRMGWHHGRHTQPQLISIIVPSPYIYTNYYANAWLYTMESTCVMDLQVDKQRSPSIYRNPFHLWG